MVPYNAQNLQTINPIMVRIKARDLEPNMKTNVILTSMWNVATYQVHGLTLLIASINSLLALGPAETNTVSPLRLTRRSLT